MQSHFDAMRSYFALILSCSAFHRRLHCNDPVGMLFSSQSVKVEAAMISMFGQVIESMLFPRNILKVLMHRSIAKGISRRLTRFVEAMGVISIQMVISLISFTFHMFLFGMKGIKSLCSSISAVMASTKRSFDTIDMNNSDSCTQHE